MRSFLGFLFLLFFLVGCYDAFHDPAIISDFKYPVVIKGSMSDVAFNYQIDPGDIFWRMEKGIEYRQLMVFKDDVLFYSVNKEDFDRMLAQNPYKVVIWKLSESGVELISEKEAELINKKLFKPKKRNAQQKE